MSERSGKESARPRDGHSHTDGFFRRLLDSLADGVYFVDTDRRITYWNRAAEAISGYSAADVIGRYCRDNLLVHTDSDGCQLCLNGCPLLSTFHDQCCRQADIFLKHKAGHRVPVSVRVSPLLGREGEVIGGVEVFSDNSSKLAALEKAEEMEQLAFIDPLTGAGNRRYSEKVLRDHCERFCRDGETFAILFIDLDEFKSINDKHGHAAGDAALRAVSKTLMNNLRSYDFLGRWGGDEFVVVLAGADLDSAESTASRCRAQVGSCSIDWGEVRIQPTISAGIAVVRVGDSPELLLSRADAQLRAVKNSGRDGSAAR